MGKVKGLPIRFGIMGTGMVARQFAHGLRSISDARITAVGSRTRETASQFASVVGATVGHDSYEALAQDENVDVIYIATPVAVHAENALLCLRHGKPVLVEKPFAANLEQAMQVIHAAREKSLFCMEAMWMRFIPAVQMAIDKARDGSIGEPHTLLADFGIPLQFSTDDHRFERENGGAWLDRGVYGLSLAVWLFGEPQSVMANATTASTGCDMQSSAIVRFKPDQMAVVTASFSGYSSNEAVIAGSTGRIKLQESFVRPDTFGIKPAPVQSGSLRPMSQSFKDRMKEMPVVRRISRIIRRSETTYVPFQGNGFSHEAAEVIRCLREGSIESPIMPWSDTLTVLRTSDKIRAAWLCRKEFD
jgi:predicted dehydrogenase